MNGIKKKESKTKTVTTKVTEEQSKRLDALAKKAGVTRSNLIQQLIEIGYKDITKNKTF